MFHDELNLRAGLPIRTSVSALTETPRVPTGPQFDNRRVAAAVIDLVPALLLGVLAGVAGLSLTVGLQLVLVGWALYYFFALESGDGQTLGKRLMKLRVVSADGSPATMRQIATRTVVRIVDGHIIGLVAMLATGDRRQRLGDLAAGTVVTDADALAPAGETGPEPGAVPVAEREHAFAAVGTETEAWDESERELDREPLDREPHEREPVVEFLDEAHDPVVEPLEEGDPEALEEDRDPVVEFLDEQPEPRAAPIETVSAVDLVMQDGEDRRSDADGPEQRPSL